MLVESYFILGFSSHLILFRATYWSSRNFTRDGIPYSDRALLEPTQVRSRAWSEHSYHLGDLYPRTGVGVCLFVRWWVQTMEGERLVFKGVTTNKPVTAKRVGSTLTIIQESAHSSLRTLAVFYFSYINVCSRHQ